ncbi:MAG: DUF4340 domain-containing protein, partial [Verrucomicrobiota bacterium]
SVAMKLRTLVLAVVILAVLSGGVALFNRPPAAPVGDVRVGQPLVAAELVNQAVLFRIADAGKTVELKKSAEGGWRVASYFDFPADLAKLASFAGDLTETKISRLVTTSPAALSRLEFKDTRVQLLNAAGQPLVELVYGKNADTGGRFVRYATEDKAYLASLSSFLDTDSKNWADSSLLQLKSDDIAKIELSFPAETAMPPRTEVTVLATRAKKEEPFVAEHTPAGQQLKASVFTTALSNLTTLRFTDTAASDDPAVAAAKAASRRVRFTTFDGKTIAFVLGRKPEEKKPKAVVSKPADDASAKLADKPGDPAKPAEPEFDIIPAGPVFVAITHSDAPAPVNALMAKRAFQISDYILTALPQTPEEIFEPLPAPAATPPAK